MKNKEYRVGVVIAAAGKGLRMGGGAPKQFLRVGKRTLLEIVVRTFESHPSVDDIVIVVPVRHRSTVEVMVRRFRFTKVSAIVNGGRERQHSVRLGLEGFTITPSIVLVHDAARPLIDRRTIDRVIHGTRRFGAAIVGTPVKDTLKHEGRRGYITKTVPRSKLWAVQTPQGFRFDLLVKAHKAATKSRFLGTDEASLVERLGFPVRIVHGNERNIKITTPGDLHLLRTLLRI